MSNTKIDAANRRIFGRPQVSWALYDFANSAFTTIIITFVFASYFKDAIAPTTEIGLAWWSLGFGISQVLIAIASPILGAIADNTGPRKPWIALFSIIAIAGSFALWFMMPGKALGYEADLQQAFFIWSLAIVIFANVGYELAIVFYNAMLSDLANRDNMGRISGFAWGLGYVGGLISLFLCLVMVMMNPLGLDESQFEHIRATSLIVGVWFALFCLPLFFFTPDTPSAKVPLGTAVSKGLSELGTTIRRLPSRPNLLKFLVAHLFYRDGLNAIFAVGAIFAAEIYGLKTEETLMFGILLNITSALGSWALGWADDKLGSRNTLILSILCLVAVAIPLVLGSEKLWLYILAAILGLFVGSIQSCSRTMVARFAEPGKEAETFGLFAFSGKATAFIGPTIAGLAVAMTGNARLGMASLILLMAIGLVLLFLVKEPSRD